MDFVVKKLEEKNIEYVTAVVEEGGITSDISSSSMIQMATWLRSVIVKISQFFPFLHALSSYLKPMESLHHPNILWKRSWEMACSGGVASLMMDNLVVDMMDISI
ncbi:hypothetical protein GH714_020555 [Hevea brasiliensis]|uniref:Uncharacterized protein n=1 Tax=Hevea brasiliensis TaxID=3981 RepID=A0A6A6N141_HEVBR|nr:hypothetical protein GH714_020555 [Hevea brasiliensis]